MAAALAKKMHTDPALRGEHPGDFGLRHLHECRRERVRARGIRGKD